MFDLVKRLLDVEAELVLTVTAPLNRRRPHDEADRIRLRNLLTEARSLVAERADRNTAMAVLAQLDAEAERLELAGGAHGLFLYATAETAETHLLSFPVEEAVSVGTTPATRFLVQGVRRSPQYRVLVISDDPSRLYSAIRDDLQEVTDHGFPFVADIVPRDNRAVAGRFARKPAGDDKEQRRNFYREVDQALTEASRHEPLPLVLVGVKNSVDLFEEVSDNAGNVIGTVHGSHENTNAADLGKLTWPILRDHLRSRRQEVASELSKAAHAGNAITGIEDVWTQVRHGHSGLLVVEEDYSADPAIETDYRLVWADSGADLMDDPVDELVEHLLRAGGRVEFVESGALVDFGRIALLNR